MNEVVRASAGCGKCVHRMTLLFSVLLWHIKSTNYCLDVLSFL